MSFDTFEAVHDLPEPSLRDLLEAGEPAERVWAAWALALRLGAAAEGVVRHAATREPDGGIRRHLVIVLAGFGEAAAVAALASGDPDPFVRATANQYAARLALRFPQLWALVKNGLADPAASVRTTLVMQLPADAPADAREAWTSPGRRRSSNGVFTSMWWPTRSARAGAPSCWRTVQTKSSGAFRSLAPRRSWTGGL